MYEDNTNEWLEADGLGGFASGTVSTIRTRRYHGLLLTATTPPTGRVMLVNGFEAWLDTPSGRIELSAHRYAGDVVYPRGSQRIRSFTTEPWPTWAYDAGASGEVLLEIVVIPGRSATILRWTMRGDPDGVTLHVRPLLSGRDYHGLQRENASADLTTRRAGGSLTWRTYPDIPPIRSLTNGRWDDDATWYRDFLYTAERQRGLDDREDLASPGVLHFTMSEPAVWMVGGNDLPRLDDVGDVLAREGARRAAFASPVHRAAEAYLVSRGAGRTVIAGYPWFTDWGRDTFIAMRGLCLAVGRLDDARDILMEWASTLSGGMLPNRFTDSGGVAEYNSVDAALWFVVATGELLSATTSDTAVLTSFDRECLQHAITRVLEGLARGTRYGIHCDRDGLLACGERGMQVTWMDAKAGDRVITPRVGKPVEVQALWINALTQGAALSHRWNRLVTTARASFAVRFWNEAGGCLYDVVDVDHVSGTVDASMRPNQIFAVGGLPTAALTGARARQVVDRVEAHLLTPLGLRTLSPSSADYVPRYEGNAAARDAAYHQGTAWPWLMGAFVDAWLNVRGDSAAARQEARERFLRPIEAHLNDAGLGHVSEIVDAEAPFAPRGCPFQAWSLGELIRLQQRLTYT